MSLQDEFEKEHFERPVEPYSESTNPEQWCNVLAWTEKYVAWLEEKITTEKSQSTPCEGCTAIEECRPYWGEEHPACYKD